MILTVLASSQAFSGELTISQQKTEKLRARPRRMGCVGGISAQLMPKASLQASCELLMMAMDRKTDQSASRYIKCGKKQDLVGSHHFVTAMDRTTLHCAPSVCALWCMLLLLRPLSGNHNHRCQYLHILSMQKQNLNSLTV